MPVTINQKNYADAPNTLLEQARTTGYSSPNGVIGHGDLIGGKEYRPIIQISTGGSRQVIVTVLAGGDALTRMTSLQASLADAGGKNISAQLECPPADEDKVSMDWVTAGLDAAAPNRPGLTLQVSFTNNVTNEPTTFDLFLEPGQLIASQIIKTYPIVN